jgi:hypothetical protein
MARFKLVQIIEHNSKIPRAKEEDRDKGGAYDLRNTIVGNNSGQEVAALDI